MTNPICCRKDDIDALTQYVDKPVYVRGYCWGKKFDGWTVLYESSNPHLVSKWVFDYRGKTYSAWGFLPSYFDSAYCSTYDNAFYGEVVEG